MALSTGTVLVVDDQATNREVLCDLLEADGFQVLLAEDGPSGLQSARAADPDAILLDVMMPGMTGFEMCQQLKEDPLTQAVPVLMVTALSDLSSRLEGRRAGADDFVTKPIDITETLLRVRNAVRSQQRWKKLRELEAFKETLMRMVVHDLKTPVATMVLLARTLRNLSMSEENRDLALRQIVGAGQRALDMVGSLLDLQCAEAGVYQAHLQIHDLHHLLEDTLESARLFCTEGECELRVGPESRWVQCDADLVRRLVANLLDNALQVIPARGGRIVVEVACPTAREVKVVVKDNGPGLDPAHQAVIFDPYVQLRDSPLPLSVGLGLSSCKMAVEAHGGKIGVDSEPGHGAAFWFTLLRSPEGGAG